MGKGKSFLAGALAGAAALFLSKKENRAMVAKKTRELGDKAKKEADVIKDRFKEAKKDLQGKK